MPWLEAQPTGPAAKTPLPFGTQSKNTPWLLMGPATLSGAQSPLCLCLSCCKKPEAWLNLQSWGREFYSQNNKVLFFFPQSFNDKASFKSHRPLILKQNQSVPIVAQRKGTRLVSMRMWVRSWAWLSGIMIRGCCGIGCRCGLYLALL